MVNAVATRMNSPTTPTGRERNHRVYRYDAIINLLLAEPALTNKEIAAKLGKTAVWVSYIMQTDAFQLVYADRRAEHNAILSTSIGETLQQVAKKSLGLIVKTLDENPEKVKLDQAVAIADKALERLGYGVKLPGTQIPGITVNQQNNNFALSLPPATRAELESARDMIRDREVNALPAMKTVTPPAPEPQLASLLRTALPVEDAVIIPDDDEVSMSGSEVEHVVAGNIRRERDADNDEDAGEVLSRR